MTKKLTDAEWQKVMDQTQGNKIARALYESLTKRSQEFGFAVQHEMIPWENQIPAYKECLIAVVGDLFDNEVIEGGNALPKLYSEIGDQ